MASDSNEQSRFASKKTLTAVKALGASPAARAVAFFVAILQFQAIPTVVSFLFVWLANAITDGGYILTQSCQLDP